MNEESFGKWTLQYIVDDPSNIIAALPGECGTNPHAALIVVGLEPAQETGRVAINGGVIQWLEDMPEVLSVTPELLRQQDRDMALAVLIDPYERQPETPGEISPDHRQIIGNLYFRLARKDILLVGAWTTPSISAGSPWWSLLGDARGIVADPDATTVSPLAVADGLLFQADPETQNKLKHDASRFERLSIPLLTGFMPHLQRVREIAESSDPKAREKFVADRFAYVNEQIGSYDPSKPVASDIAVEIAGWVGIPEIMERLARAAIDPATPDRFGEFWADLSRVVPDPVRARTTALVGLFAYARDDLALARHALDESRRARPGYEFGRVMRAALRIEIPSHRLHELFSED
ncbi:DUF4192 domain-containing protein [Nocardia terpenica]|uniref:DUF4192 family protein n=1 Tax=Nocardia terpenica TaxID=455432 RepID=A0A6G9ZDS2_9NOCA|nr:DUF4192 domain-containing protein [Nocardia terpenica]QIS23662.1 DUF4192 family protein [Nocardia terpenica]